MSSHRTLSHHQPAIQSQKSRDIAVQDPTNLDQHKDKYLALLTDTTADPFNFLGAQQTVNEFATTKQHVEKQKEVSSAVSESFARFQRNFVCKSSSMPFNPQSFSLFS